MNRNKDLGRDSATAPGRSGDQVSPPDRAELGALFERVMAATGPDREIDCAIALALDGFFLAEPRYPGAPIMYGYVDADGSRVEPGQSPTQLVRTYTDSVDAALALIRRLKPGYQINISDYGETAGADASLGARGYGLTNHAATPALALILALLRALQSQQEV